MLEDRRCFHNGWTNMEAAMAMTTCNRRRRDQGVVMDLLLLETFFVVEVA
jgi:hypothetical protein